MQPICYKYLSSIQIEEMEINAEDIGIELERINPYLELLIYSTANIELIVSDEPPEIIA